MFKIEKGVPPPNRRSIYPFAEMTVGDSFEFKSEVHSRIRAVASAYGKRNGMKFSVRCRNGKGRVWRVK